jgi:hypothetical protein
VRKERKWSVIYSRGLYRRDAIRLSVGYAEVIERYLSPQESYDYSRENPLQSQSLKLQYALLNFIYRWLHVSVRKRIVLLGLQYKISTETLDLLDIFKYRNFISNCSQGSHCYKVGAYLQYNYVLSALYKLQNKA